MADQASESGLAPAHLEEGEGVDLWHYLEVLRKRKWVILATVAVVVTAAVLYTLQQTPIYRATSSAVVNPRAPQVYGSEVQEVVQLGSENQWSNEEYHNTQVEIIRTYDLAEETVRANDLHNDPRMFPDWDGAQSAGEEERIARAAGILNRAVDANMRHRSRILELHVRHADPELAADLANAHIDTYIAASIGARAEHTDKAVEILAAELDDAEAALRDAQRKLAEFRRENEIVTVSLDDRLNSVASDLAKYSEELRNARVERIKLGTVRDQVQRAEEIDDVLESPIFALTERSGVEGLRSAFLRERRELIEMSGTLGPQHPDRIAQEKKVEELRADIEREKRLAVREIGDRYDAVRANEREFQREFENTRQEAIDLGDIHTEHDELASELELANKAYETMRQRLRDSQLTGRNQLSNIEPNTRARVPRAPVEPNLTMNIGLAVALALFLGLGLAFGLEYLDRTIRSPQDVEGHSGAPLLGVIPDIGEDRLPDDPKERLRARDLFVYQHPTSHAAECARSIRTNILFSSASRELKVLMLASPNPREGKTTSVLHLGTTMAQSGQRVLLVDTDMRKPRLHQSAGVPRGVGISSLMLGESSIEEAIKQTEIPDLDVLPCGPTPPNPAELLLTRRFEEIIADLRGRYDRIILDSPPLQAVTDATVLSRLVDGSIIVAKAKLTPREDLARATKKLREVDAHVVGVILNDLDLSERKYGYYHYGYGYGDGGASDAGAASKG